MLKLEKTKRFKIVQHIYKSINAEDAEIAEDSLRKKTNTEYIFDL